MDTKSDQRIFEELFAGNDPVLRSEVRAALKKRGVHKINPINLEFALKYGQYEYNAPARWFEKKHRLHVRLRQTLRDMAKAPMEEWPDYASDIIDRVLRRPYGYKALRLSDGMLPLQPHPDSFLQALQEGADPKEILLSMCNIWMGKHVFIRCANALGNDILSWDDERNLSWREWKKGRPENQHLCEDISVQPAGLVAVEPFTIQHDDSFDYALYGSVVADVTSFVVSFKPKEGIDPQILRRYVYQAIRDFIDKGWQTFRAPDCHYTNPENAYDRPCAIKYEEFRSIIILSSNLAYTLENQYPDIVRCYEESHFKDDEDKKKYAHFLTNTGHAIADFLQGKEAKKPLPTEIIDYLKSYQDVMDVNYHTRINADGDVVINKALILDDVLELYKFCDTFLTPCVSVAQSLNVARFAEECGPVKTPDGLYKLDEGYASENMDMADRLGNLADATPEQLIDRAQHDILVLLGMGESTLQTAFYQVGTLAHGTLTGLLPDGTGQYPAIQQITDTAEGHAISQENDLMPQRMRKMIERMANRYGLDNGTDTLKNRFMQAAKTAAELARYQEKIEKICNEYERNLDRYKLRRTGKSSSKSIIDEMDEGVLAHERARALDAIQKGLDYNLDISPEGLIKKLLGTQKKPDFDINKIKDTEPPPAHLDTLGRYMWLRGMIALQEKRGDFKKDWDNPTRREPKQDIGLRSNHLTKWGGKIGVQLPRGFKETGYIIRNNHTPFARPGTELPRDLEQFVSDKPDERKGPLLPNPAEVFFRPK